MIKLYNKVSILGLFLADLPQYNGPKKPPGRLGDNFTDVLGYISWAVFVAAIIGLFVIAGRLVLATRRGEGREVLHELLWWIIGVVIVASASGILAMIAGNNGTGS